MNKTAKRLDIYVDESGNFDNYSKHNLIYSVAFVLVDSRNNNVKPLCLFESKLSNIVGGEHFVHTGSLVRKEKPYEEMSTRERQDLFYILFLLAKHANYKVACSLMEKKKAGEEIYENISDSIFDAVNRMKNYLSEYDEILIHYDNGQDLLKGVLLVSFRTINKNVKFVKTLQQGEPFMQVADLYSYFELLSYKVSNGLLGKNEELFFGMGKKIKADYLKQLEDKYL